MPSYLHEPARSTPLRASYDTVVCGGGIAGIAAALAAARHGARTALVEREYVLGGLATLGLITIYLPLCDGCGRQVSFGLAEELLHLSVSHGAEGRDLPRAWMTDDPDPAARTQNRYQVQYNPSVFALLAEQVLRGAGVEIYYGLSVVGGRVSRGRLRAVLCEGREGRMALGCRNAVDATGDATLCRLLGLPTATYAYRNTLPSWYYYQKGDRNHLQMLGYAENPNLALSDSAENPAVDPTKPHFTGLDTVEVSRMTEAAHDQLLSHFLSRGDLSPTYSLTSIATVPQLRMTARLAGEYTLDVSESHRPMPDSIGMISDWRQAGPVYEVPFGSLWSRACPNLAVAGRLISVTDKMWDLSRVIPACAVTGEAAGTACALSQNFGTLSVSRLQNTLRQAGVIIHEKELIK